MRFSAPLVSALVTTFNHEAYIADAIESLLGQTYPAVEIIVVDDGSQDRTFDIACRYRERGVKVLRGPQKGPSHAMNLAMSEGAGEVFLLQSGDDLSYPFRAEVQVHALADIDLHAGLPILIDGEGLTRPDTEFPALFRPCPDGMPSLFASLYQDGNFLCASSVAMRRTVWEKLGGFNPGLLQLQDYDYWLRAVVDGLILSVTTQRLIKYRIHGTNLSSSRYDVRMHRELGAIFRGLSPKIPNDCVEAVLYSQSFRGLAWSNQDREILNALLFLRHPIETVRQIGFEALLNLLVDDDMAATLEKEFGLSFRMVFDLLLRQ